MTESAVRLGRLPDADDFAAGVRRKTLWYTVLAMLLAAAICAPLLLGIDAPILPFIALGVLLAPVFVWHFPRLAFYVTFGSVCLFELVPKGYSDSLTDRVPFFWNVNTIIQTYSGADFKGIPLNLFELLLVFAGTCAFVRGVLTRTLRIEWAPLALPIGIYIAFVGMGWINGMLTGGDFKISLQEVRAQFYFFIAYLMAVNIIRTRRQVEVLLWMTVLLIGFKGFLYTYRRHVTLAGLELPDQGVGSHEEAFFFNAALVLVIGFALCGEGRGWRALWWSLLPVVVTGNLATNRRAATAALVVVLPILILAAYQALPKRRRVVALVGVLLAVGCSIYYPMFKNSQSMWAQPARAIRSHFEPDARDASSNAYRDAENACIMATIRSSPLLGYGYGKRMIKAVPIADISKLYEWWDILPHNQILWVWMRVGTFGFIAFWIMISAIIVRACRTLRDEDAGSFEKAVGLFVLLCVAMLLLFGLLDLQISNFRNMLFVGFWVGILAVLPRLRFDEAPRFTGARL